MAALAGVATAGLTILKDFFEINATSIDNWTFKLFYKWSTAIFVFSRYHTNIVEHQGQKDSSYGSHVGLLSELFFQPIDARLTN